MFTNASEYGFNNLLCEKLSQFSAFSTTRHTLQKSFIQTSRTGKNHSQGFKDHESCYMIQETDLVDKTSSRGSWT